MEFTRIIETIGQALDLVGVVTIIVGAVVSVPLAFRRVRSHGVTYYSAYRLMLGRSILLGLELLVAADIIKTVAVTPTLESIAVLAGIVVIRTFLSFSLQLEVTGRWPWQKAPAGANGEEPAG